MTQMHSNGPWVADHAYGEVSSDDGSSVAIVLNSTNFKGNINLIAAAPDLLEALKSIIRYGRPANIETHPENSFLAGKKPSTADVWTFPKHMLDAVESAISKSEGLS